MSEYNISMWRKINLRKSSDPKRKGCPWVCRWRPGDGRHYQRAFPNKLLAEDFRRQMELKINSSEFAPVVGIGWVELEREFLANKPDLSQASVKIYKAVFAELGKVLPDLLSKDFGQHQLDIYVKSLTGTAATRNKKLRHLRSIMAWATKRAYMPSVLEVEHLAEAKRLPTVWTPEQFESALAQANREWRILMLLCLNGVGRKNSVAQLKIGQIDVEHGQVKIYDQKQKEERITPLHTDISKELVDYINDLPDGQEQLFTQTFPNGVWVRLCKRAGVPRIKFHHLRSCLNSWLRGKGVSGAVIKDIFGHSDQKVTDAYYTNLDIQAKRDAIDKLPINLRRKP